MKEDLDQYIQLTCWGGWKYLPAQKILFDNKEDLKFQEAASYARILMRVASLIKDKNDEEIFFSSVDDIVARYKNHPTFKEHVSEKRWSYVDDNLENDLTTALEMLLRIPGNFKTGIELLKSQMQDRTEELTKELAGFLPKEECPEPKLREYTITMFTHGAESSEAREIFEKHKEDKNFVVWAEAQKKYRECIGRKKAE